MKEFTLLDSGRLKLILTTLYSGGTNPQHDIKLFRAETFPASEKTSVLKLEATR